MENNSPAAVPSTIQTASSKKKKAKKEKKRKRNEVTSSPNTPIAVVANGSSSKSSSKRKKAKKDKKDKKKDKLTTDSTEQERAPRTISEDLTPPASAAEIQKSSSQSAATAQPIIGGSIISLLASTVRGAASANRSSADGSSKQLTNSPYQTKTIQGTVALLPSSLPDVPKCIQSLLNSLLLMYDANMGGVLLSLQDDKPKLLPIDHKPSGKNSGLVGGRIVDDLPYIHYKFQFRGVLFCPSVGMKLKGQVVECTPTFVTLTTHHILSTKISTEKLQSVGFFYDELSMEWTRERDAVGEGGEGEEGAILGPSTSIYLDDIVEFVVERIHECGGYISLDGRSPSVSTLG